MPTLTKKTAAETTTDRLRAEILGGALAAGSDLPGERGLAETLGVSRLTLRSAIARLETEGLVESVHGSGTRVLDYRESGGIELIGYLAAESLASGAVPLGLLAELMELRRMVASEVLAIVCERASDRELDELADHLAWQRTLAGSPEAFMRADLAFARKVVRAAHNLALELLYNTVARLVAAEPAMHLAFQSNVAQTLAVYARLLELVRAREPRRAARVSRRILQHLDRVTIARIRALAEEKGSEPC